MDSNRDGVGVAFHVFGLLRVPIFRPCGLIPLPEIRLPWIPLLLPRALVTVDWAARVLAGLLRLAAEDGPYPNWATRPLSVILIWTRSPISPAASRG
jgi:hypothetical protein